MHYWMIGLALAMAAIDWFAVYTNNIKLGYFAKPGVMLVLLVWLVWGVRVYALQGAAGGLKSFFWALMFSLVGDIFLMLPKRQFVAGLVAFLFGHLMYIRGLWVWPWQNDVMTAGIVLALVMLPVLMMTFFRLVQGVAIRNKPLVFPVVLYSLIIGGMVYMAIFNAFVLGSWLPLPGYLLASGALLFMFSDMLLGWNKFVRPMAHARLKNHIPYHLGQILLTLGATIHFVNLA